MVLELDDISIPGRRRWIGEIFSRYKPQSLAINFRYGVKRTENPRRYTLF